MRLTNANVEKPRAMRMAWESVAIEGFHDEAALAFRRKLLRHAAPKVDKLGDDDCRSFGGWYLELDPESSPQTQGALDNRQ